MELSAEAEVVFKEDEVRRRASLRLDCGDFCLLKCYSGTMSKYLELFLILALLTFIAVGGIYFVKERVFVVGQTAITIENETPITVNRVDILAFGDLMLDRTVYLKTLEAQDFNFPFLKIDSFLSDADIRIANLEGPITDYNSVAIKDNRMRFTISPNFLPALKSRFEIFTLANNHMQDFGENGYNQTKQYLNSAGITYFGDYKNRAENLSTIIEKNGIKIGFVGYHDLDADYADPDAIAEKIKTLKTETDFVIVFAHWGAEYKTEAPQQLKDEAHKFINAGADVVLGSHPHVIEPSEEYKGKMIYYSLGNFIFDQYFSAETMEGLAVEITAEKSAEGKSISCNAYKFNISSNSQPFIGL
jgi:poly-gamma-glutamate synthesis protein (capsule biosynthesis protein)